MSQNLQKFAKFQKLQLDNLVDFEKCCKTRTFLQKSMPIQPTTSNILPKFCRSAVVSPTGARLRRDAEGRHRRRCRSSSRAASAPWRSRAVAYLGCRMSYLAIFCEFLAGLFSAVSKPIFASKYAFCSIFQNLQDSNPFAPLETQNFAIF